MCFKWPWEDCVIESKTENVKNHVDNPCFSFRTQVFSLLGTQAYSTTPKTVKYLFLTTCLCHVIAIFYNVVVAGRQAECLIVMCSHHQSLAQMWFHWSETFKAVVWDTVGERPSRDAKKEFLSPSVTSGCDYSLKGLTLNPWSQLALKLQSGCNIERPDVFRAETDSGEAKDFIFNSDVLPESSHCWAFPPGSERLCNCVSMGK